MLVCRLNNCRSPTIGEKYERPLSLSSGLNSSFALSCALLVIAPKSAHVVSLSAFTVRSGSALPSVHQYFQPISQGTYSASNFIRSRTIRAASITSLPTPSPGIHAILYLDIGLRPYRQGLLPQVVMNSHLRSVRQSHWLPLLMISTTNRFRIDRFFAIEQPLSVVDLVY